MEPVHCGWSIHHHKANLHAMRRSLGYSANNRRGTIRHMANWHVTSRRTEIRRNLCSNSGRMIQRNCHDYLWERSSCAYQLAPAQMDEVRYAR
jgi:hypothetical protein